MSYHDSFNHSTGDFLSSHSHLGEHGYIHTENGCHVYDIHPHHDGCILDHTHTFESSPQMCNRDVTHFHNVNSSHIMDIDCSNHPHYHPPPSLTGTELVTLAAEGCKDGILSGMKKGPAAALAGCLVKANTKLALGVIDRECERSMWTPNRDAVCTGVKVFIRGAHSIAK